MTPLTRSSTVCALLPHHDCGHWLPGAIESLLTQTRPPDAILVLDDASPHPPLAIAQRYPSVTFLRVPENVGPYRMVQAAIDRTAFDAYLFQDADDLSHPERLATLLDVAAAQRAEIVGSHEVQVDVAAPEARTREYALDVNAALADNPIAFALLHPTSLVGRDAVMRTGGFAGGLRFGADIDFLWRAAHVARVVNADRHLYIRRRHRESLTGSKATGTRSVARRRLDTALRERARANVSRAARGEAPDLSTFSSAPPVVFEHLAGPEVGARPVTRRSGSMSAGAAGAGPVLVVGGPRNGGDVLSWALDLHPNFEAVPDWSDLDRNGSGTGRRPVVAGPGVSARALALTDRHPDAKVLYVYRDVEATVASLVVRPDAHGDFYSEELARAAAVDLGTTCELLEAALGPERVLRVRLARLVEDPATVMHEVLTFLGETMVTQTVLPFTGLQVRAGSGSEGIGAGATATEARRLLADRLAPKVQPLPGRLRALVSGHLRDDAVVAVVSRGDSSLLELGAGRAWHFPRADDGSYAGEYPPAGPGAVTLLEAVRGRGATHLLVPAPASWWLDFYGELRSHLDRRYRLLAASDGTGVLYDLSRCRARQSSRSEAVAG